MAVFSSLSFGYVQCETSASMIKSHEIYRCKNQTFFQVVSCFWFIFKSSRRRWFLFTFSTTHNILGSWHLKIRFIHYFSMKIESIPKIMQVLLSIWSNFNFLLKRQRFIKSILFTCSVLTSSKNKLFWCDFDRWLRSCENYLLFMHEVQCAHSNYKIV